MNSIEKEIDKIMKTEGAPSVGASAWLLIVNTFAMMAMSLLGTMGVSKCIEPMWEWFITPVTGVSVPAYWTLVGFMMTMGVFTNHIKKSDIGEPDPTPLATVFKFTITRVLAAVISLIIGWFVHQMV